MELTPQEQIKKIVAPSKEILLIAEARNSIDSLSSLLAFHLFLNKIGKKNDPIAQMEKMKDLDFLPAFSTLKSNLKGAKDFIISLDISRTKVEQFKYNIKDNKLNIYITPSNGCFEPRDIETKKGKSKYDLIITLSTPALEKLGSLYEENAEIFYESPLVNIDCHPNNENFGEINLVELAVSSTSEILFSLFQTFDSKNITPEIATCLLAGIIDITESFQAQNTTPAAFTTAAKLVEMGANREMIIHHFYKTRPLSHLRLWGRTLARLKTAADQRVIWSLLSPVDFEKSKSEASHLDQILSDLKNNTAKSEIVFLLAEDKPNSFHLKIKKVNKNIDLNNLEKILKEQGFQAKENPEDAIAFTKNEGILANLEQDILNAIKGTLPA